MSSLPFISHHLFVAAARQESRHRRKPARPASPARAVAGGAKEVRLELLEPCESNSARPAGGLQLALLAAET